MNDDDTAEEIEPVIWHGIEIYRWEGWLTCYAWGRWRLNWYKLPADWTVGWLAQEESWQLELGPLVVAYVRPGAAGG